MVLTPMRLQGIVGIYAGPSQAVRFFKVQPRNVSKHSSTSPLSIHVELDGVLVGHEQLGACFAGHSLIHPSRWFTKTVCSSGNLAGLFRIRVF
jgi:hypothetical protein